MKRLVLVLGILFPIGLAAQEGNPSPVKYQRATVAAAQAKVSTAGDEAAVEVGDVLEPAAVGGFTGVHRGEKAADQVVGVSGAVALVQEVGDEILLQEANVFGEEGNQH